MGEEKEIVRRFLSPAEKRAVRRARVLQGSESRLKLLKGEITKLKVPSDESSATSLETKLDEGIDELLAPDSDSEASPPITEPLEGLENLNRVGPLQRRRDAAARRRKKEKMVQEMLDSKTNEVAALKSSEEIASLHFKESLPATFSPKLSRHLTTLQLYSLEEKLMLLLIVVAATYAAVYMDLSAITTSLVADDQLLVNYQDLIASGVPMDSIRQQFEREKTLPEMREKLERLLTKKLRMEAVDTSATTSGWVPGVADLGFLFTSLLAHPPVVLLVFFVRMLVSTVAKSVKKALDLPDIKNIQEGDLGFAVNLALSGRPVLKEFLVVGRKSLDDVFVFIFLLVVFVAIRAIWLT